MRTAFVLTLLVAFLAAEPNKTELVAMHNKRKIERFFRTIEGSELDAATKERILRLREGASVSESELRDTAGEHIAGYKLPKVFVFVNEIVRSPSGKADYRWAKSTALERMVAGAGEPS